MDPWLRPATFSAARPPGVLGFGGTACFLVHVNNLNGRPPG